MFIFWIPILLTPGVKNSNSLRVVSTVRVGRQRNRSSIPLQNNIFLCSFHAASGAHPASYAVGFEGVERPVCETDHLPSVHLEELYLRFPVHVHGAVLF